MLSNTFFFNHEKGFILFELQNFFTVENIYYQSHLSKYEYVKKENKKNINLNILNDFSSQNMLHFTAEIDGVGLEVALNKIEQCLRPVSLHAGVSI